MASRNFLSLKEKIDIIKVQEKEKLTVRELAKRFNIGKTQAAEISRNKDAIKAKWQSGTNLNQKKNCLTPKGSQVDKLCYDWFIKNKQKGIHISGPIIQAKAKEIAERVKYIGFLASDGWLEKWRKRHNIALKISKKELPSMLRSYKLEDAYSVDDSCLLFPALPDKTNALKSEKCIGDKLPKERLTLNDPLEILSDLEEDLNTQTTDSINTYDEALKQIARLKQFARNDLVSLQTLNKLESRFTNMQLKGKQVKK